jgi:glycosyltransferase involved in cell wall biosynthesis
MMNSGSMSLPKISVVTPSLNQGRFIERTIESVLGQGYPRLEYILIDGGSTDGSLDVVRRHASRLAHWEVIPGSSQVDALNAGFERATGDVLAWLNSDDVYLPGTLAEVGRHFADPELEFLYGQRVVIDEDDRPLADQVIPSCDPLRFMIFGFGALHQEACFWRARLHRAVGSISATHSHAFDYDFLLRLLIRAEGRWRRVPRPLTGFRTHPGQKTLAYDAQGRRIGYLQALAIRDAHRRALGISAPSLWIRYPFYRALRRWTMGRTPWRRTSPRAGILGRAREFLR